MRDIPAGMIPGNVREISSYAVVRNRLPVFEELHDKSYLFYDHDVAIYGTGVYRVASMPSRANDVAYLHTLEIPDLNNVPLSLISTNIETWPYSGVSICDGNIFYHKVNGDIVRRDIATGTELVYTNIQSDVGLAAVTSTELYIMYYASGTTCRIQARNGVGLISEWDGAAYGERILPSTIDAERLEGVDYIVWQNSEKRNARMIKRVGHVWSESWPVFPLDVVDDTFQFRLGGASIVDGRFVLVGTLVRDRSSMKIYTIGPERFTAGREMFIAPGHVADAMVTSQREITLPIGKMLKVDDMLYVIGGDSRYHKAKSTVLFGSDREDQKVTVGIHAAGPDVQANRPERIGFEIESTDSELLRAGSLIDWHAVINGVEARLGRYVIEVTSTIKGHEGNRQSVLAQSLSMKNLATWNSDSSFDYWSQTKLTARASDMAKTIRGDGKWEENCENIRFLDYNKPGILYSVSRATRNGTAAGEFRVDAAANYSARYGVAIAYNRETPQDAAARLGDTFAEREDTLSHGLFFTVNSLDGSSGLYWVVNDEWTQIASGGTPILTSDWHWLRVDFREGYIRCYYRIGTDWVLAIEHLLLTDLVWPVPWFRDEIGRAALYLENMTPGAVSYPFTSDAMIVPVETVAPYPAAETVKVDDEMIRYSGLSPDRLLATRDAPLEWVYGRTYKGVDQPHVNPVITTASNILFQVDASPAYWRHAHGHECIGGSFKASSSYSIKAIDLYLTKKGTADAVAEVWLCTADSLRWGFPSEHFIVARQSRTFRYGSTSNMLAGTGTFTGGYGWVRFNLPTTLRAGETYVVFLINKDGKNIPASGYFNVGNTYGPRTNHKVYRYTWEWLTYDQAMMMRLVGYGSTYEESNPPSLPGYEVYLDTVGVERPIDYYNNCAFVCVDGPGKGRSIKIRGYDYHAPHQWNGPDNAVGDLTQGEWVDMEYRRISIAKDPNLYFGEDSKFVVVPALQVIERGFESEAANHDYSRAALVNEALFEVGGGAEAHTFEYYSADPDLTLGGMLTEIARKANVLDVGEEMRMDGPFTAGLAFHYTDSLLEAVPGETAVISYDVQNWKLGGIGLAVFTPGYGEGSAVDSVAVVIYQNEIVYYRFDYDSAIVLQRFPTPHPVQGEFTISFQKDVFSIWNNGQYLTHFYWDESEAQDTTFDRGYHVWVVNDGDISCNVRWSEIDTRVDNYILDIGQAGLSLAQQMIGEKRIFMLDDQNGDLRIFRNRYVVNSNDPLDLQIAQSDSFVDSNLRTRMRSEGVEIVESADYDAIAKYGNLFSMIGLREPDNIAETSRELRLIMEDTLKTAEAINLTGATDPRIQPEDLIEVKVEEGVNKLVRVDGVSLSMESGDSPVFDMSLRGSIWGDVGPREPTVVNTDNYLYFVTEKEQKETIETDADPSPVIEIGEL